MCLGIPLAFAFDVASRNTRAAGCKLGEHDKAMILSCADGHDKPAKYPLMFREARAMLLNKIDLLPHTNFDVDAAIADARALNPEIEVLKLSAFTREGMDTWIGWLESRMRTARR
jgi:hydrogenase nickel incorporation protein HypB